MLERVLLSAVVMVLFENVQAFNSRSETLPAFAHNPVRNRLLLFGTLAAQLVHIGAMYTPGLSTVLELVPITLEEWTLLAGVALLLLGVEEVLKGWVRWRARVIPPAVDQRSSSGSRT